MFPPYLLWVDLETTGTDEKNDAILEIGSILTDTSLNNLQEFNYVISSHSPGVKAACSRMKPAVRKMHTSNGLLSAVEASSALLSGAELSITENIKRFGEKKDFVLAGSGVGHFDRRFIDYHMPLLSSYLCYYPIDVGVIRRTFELAGSALTISEQYKSFEASKTHRALDDIRQHLEEYKFYIDKLRMIS